MTLFTLPGEESGEFAPGGGNAQELTCRWLALASLPGVGPVRLAALHRARPVWPGGWLAGLPTGAAAVLRLWLDHPVRSPLTAIIQRALDWQREAPDCHLLHPDHPRWPALLDQIADPPPVLRGRGALAALTPPRLALVGSRRPTREGLANARRFGADMARSGWCVVSGMALGVDGAAQTGALDAGGVSIAVLAGGVDLAYPQRHRGLYQRLLEEGGLLLGERAPGDRARPGDFPRRNRIVTGMSCGVLVVEAAELSGSLISARLAAEQGREVMAVPGSIHSPQAQGCLRLIREGAALVRNVDDVLAELSTWGPRQGAGSQAEASGQADVARLQDDLTQGDSLLLRWLSDAPAPVDALVGLAGCDVASCQRELTLLEISGRAALVAGGWVRLPPAEAPTRSRDVD